MPIPSTSPSKNKSSLRRASAGATKQQTQTYTQTQTQYQNNGLGLGLMPSPSFDVPERKRTGSPKTVGFDESAAQGRDDCAVAAAAGALEQAAFQPFFTLISDGLTAEHYHPTVHYVFEDDEEGEEMVSEGVLKSLARLGDGQGGRGVKGRDGSQNKEHVLILNVDVKSGALGEAAAGYEVVQVQSLSADWQVSHVEVTSAPTMSEEDADGGLMLKIEGRGPAIEDKRGHEMGRESLEDMVSRYQRGLEEIRKMAAADDTGAREREI